MSLWCQRIQAIGEWSSIDLKNLNSHINAPHFRMSTMAVVLNTLRPGDWAFKLDLQDAYLHVLIHPQSQRYLQFAFQGQAYQFRALPFGLNMAQMVFTKLVHTLAAHLHIHRVSLLPYLDDWIIHHPDHQVLLNHRTLVMRTLEVAGFLINLPKSELDPTQDLQFLGIRFQLDRGLASIPPERITSTVQLAHQYSLPTDHPLSVRLYYHQVASLLGSLNWVSAFVPLGRLRLRPLELLFQQAGLLNQQSPSALVDRVSLTQCLYHQAGGNTFPVSAHSYPGVTPLVEHTRDYTPGMSHSWSVQRDCGLPITQPPGTTLECSVNGAFCRWTCLPQSTMLNSHSLCPRFQIPRPWQSTCCPCPGRIGGCTCFHHFQY
jgi:hypothetical protein